MTLEHESPLILVHADDYIRHAHISAGSRSYPLAYEDGFGPFFEQLRAINYDSRISVEARTSDFEADARQALAVLKRL
jgi:sugar phosphate isomerase/epimerase